MPDSSEDNVQSLLTIMTFVGVTIFIIGLSALAGMLFVNFLHSWLG